MVKVGFTVTTNPSEERFFSQPQGNNAISTISMIGAIIAGVGVVIALSFLIKGIIHNNVSNIVGGSIGGVISALVCFGLHHLYRANSETTRTWEATF